MRWGLVLKAVVILYVLTAIGTLIFGVVSGLLLASFGGRMRVVAVVAIAYITSYPVHVWLIGTPFDQWAPSLLALTLAALIGVPAGRRLRQRRDLADAVRAASV